ncbi:MAG: LUD domain-containing protein [Desulfuromonadales bacterium]|nr:LUD domain-containing protein [Desulfuromonadales bacterium]
MGATEKLVLWTHEQKCWKAVDSLAKNGFGAMYCATPQDAVVRVKNWATPPNARRLNFKTPCAVTGFCSDCNSPDRLCRVTTIIDRQPRMTDMRVLVVNADLGF